MLREAVAAPVTQPTHRGYARAKRVIDAAAAACALLILAPVIAVVWVAVLVKLGRPVFFVQERVTVGGKLFRLRKFRTMLGEDRESEHLSDAERLTPFGDWLRSTSLDELPSLWNILVGDMSVVGPRPLPHYYLPIYSDEQQTRHSVRAGLTGLAQVSGRNAVPWDVRLEIDQRYVFLMGPLLDLAIVVRTVSTVLGRDGVWESADATSNRFPGPLRSTRLRFMPTDTPDTWSVVTPEDIRIATCGYIICFGNVADLHVEVHGPASSDLLVEAVGLLLNHARGAGCVRATITSEVAPVDVLMAAGLQPVGGNRFTASICYFDVPDEPSPAGPSPDEPFPGGALLVSPPQSVHIDRHGVPASGAQR